MPMARSRLPLASIELAGNRLLRSAITGASSVHSFCGRLSAWASSRKRCAIASRRCVSDTMLAMNVFCSVGVRPSDLP
ncbi:hypothetical protein UNPA324_26365 [Bradyrhizobium sp. UNPA324]|nr:hypothetical protein UNPA324_26365 [Bradyrhizobium sp. UNPA324]